MPLTGTPQPELFDGDRTLPVTSIIEAHRAGVDVDTRIAALATYLGHVSPTSTYWYLTASPELLDLVNDRIEAHRQGRIA